MKMKIVHARTVPSTVVINSNQNR